MQEEGGLPKRADGNCRRLSQTPLCVIVRVTCP